MAMEGRGQTWHTEVGYYYQAPAPVSETTEISNPTRLRCPHRIYALGGLDVVRCIMYGRGATKYALLETELAGGRPTYGFIDIFRARKSDGQRRGLVALVAGLDH